MESKKAHPLVSARERFNLTQKLLAELAGVGLATVQRAETGKRIGPGSRRQLCSFSSDRLNRDVGPEELGLVIDLIEEEAVISETLKNRYTIIEKEVKNVAGQELDAEQETDSQIESEEAMNRREAGKKIAAINRRRFFFGSTRTADPTAMDAVFKQSQ